MPNKYDKPEKCTTGREFVAYAQGKDGVDIRKNGSYVDIQYQGHDVYVPDSDRALPKPARLQIVATLFKIGLGIAVAGFLYAHWFM